jgi:hypothetical protein
MLVQLTAEQAAALIDVATFEIRGSQRNRGGHNNDVSSDNCPLCVRRRILIDAVKILKEAPADAHE